MARLGDGGVETVITDDGAAERRRRVFEPLEERARAVNGIVEVDPANEHGTVIRVTVPGYTAR
jgi:signal transduction histidine kinase